MTSVWANLVASASSRGEPLHPPVHGDVIHLGTALGEQFLDVAVRQVKAQVPAHRHHDHLRRIPETRERRRRSRPGTATGCRPHRSTVPDHPTTRPSRHSSTRPLNATAPAVVRPTFDRSDVSSRSARATQWSPGLVPWRTRTPLDAFDAFDANWTVFNRLLPLQAKNMITSYGPLSCSVRGRQCQFHHVCGATPRQRHAGTAVTIVMDDPGTSRRLFFDANGAARGAESDSVSEYLGVG
jgi:hypothetical protein